MRLSFVIAALVSGIMSIWGSQFWSTAGGIAAVVLLVLWIGVPVVRRGIVWRKLCVIHFRVKPLNDGCQDFLIQDDDIHTITELVLPSYAEKDVELSVRPHISIHLMSMLLHFAVNNVERPIIIDRYRPDTPKRWKPNVDDTDFTIKNGTTYQADINRILNSGTTRMFGFRIKTRSPGNFTLKIALCTAEGEHNARLLVKVENSPRSRMRCTRHRGCYVRPNISAGLLHKSDQ